MIREYLRRCFGSLSHAERMQRELDQARTALLEAFSAREYADAMCVYHTARIERLSAALREAV
jgi:hypothetical protein